MTISPFWFLMSIFEATMPRLPFDVGRTDVTSTSAWMVSPTRTGFSTFLFSSSMARPVPWIIDWQRSPSIRL